MRPLEGLVMANTNQAAGNPPYDQTNTRSAYGDSGRARSDDMRPVGFDLTPDRWWLSLLLGVLLIAGGIYMILHAVAASIVTSILFGAVLAVGGVFQIVHAFSAPDWKSRALSILIGLLFVAGGILLMLDPLAASLGLTIGIAALFVAGGALRLFLAYRLWRRMGWLLLLSGLIGIATGVIIMLGWPWSGLVVPGLLFGIDMMFHGAWWVALGIALRSERPAVRGARPARA
jgi:uncharacterized membrane protein HdeD (DUF308 family)